jgi:hypothetical protein
MAIVNTSIITYVRSPITMMISIISITKPPITRSPPKSMMRRPYPHTWYPIIISIVI